MQRFTVILTLIFLSATCGLLQARPTYTGYSGAPGRQNCASSCHGVEGGTVQVFGFPETYTPNTQYLISVRKLSGSSINNFNASCRVGTGSDNAGVIAAGNRTATYNVTGETNGVHLSQTNRDTCNFLWTAPEAGTGDVRLYVAAHQGSNMSGPNTNTTLVAAESTGGLPPQCTDPNPADGATDVALDASLSWTGNDLTWWYNIYFGTTNPPPFITFQAETSYDPGALQENTTYYWKINPGNGEGETQGEIWSFTTLANGAPPAQVADPYPADQADSVEIPVLLRWGVADGANSYDVYFGSSIDPTYIGTTTDTTYNPGALNMLTTYYWRVNSVNDFGETTGIIWSFRTRFYGEDAGESSPLPTTTALGNPYPNPFNPETTIPFTLSTSQHVTLSIYDVTGREIAVLANSVLSAGDYSVTWNSSATASGVYLVRLVAGNEVYTAKILALK